MNELTWTSVREQNPEIGVEAWYPVLLDQGDKQHQPSAVFWNGDKWCEMWSDEEVTHWLNLRFPDPPNDEEEE